jgi:hypothetical protein
MISLSLGAPDLRDSFDAEEFGLAFLLVKEAGTARTPLALRFEAMGIVAHEVYEDNSWMFAWKWLMDGKFEAQTTRR